MPKPFYKIVLRTQKNCKNIKIITLRMCNLFLIHPEERPDWMKTVNYSDEITANAGGFCVGHRGVSHQAESERLLPSDDSGQQIRWGSAGHLLALANPAISCQRTSSSNTVGIGVNCDGSSAGQSIGFLNRRSGVRVSPVAPPPASRDRGQEAAGGVWGTGGTCGLNHLFTIWSMRSTGELPNTDGRNDRPSAINRSLCAVFNCMSISIM